MAESPPDVADLAATPAAAGLAIRYRLTYRKGEEVRFISHLDVMRTLERGFRRAGLPLAYSQGFNPHARMSIAAPLAVGWTAAADVADVELTEAVGPAEVAERLTAALPAGLAATSARRLPEGARAAMAQVRSAEYTVRLRPVEGGIAAVRLAVLHLLAATSAPIVRPTAHGGAPREVDIRPLVLGCAVMGEEEDPLDGSPIAVLRADLRVGSAANAKPEHLLEALAPPRLELVSIHRDQLILEAG